MYDFLLSADLMVPDPDAHTKLLVEKLGVHSHPNWRQGFESHSYIAHFLRVNKNLAMAPTRLEPQHHFDRPNPVDPCFPAYLQSLYEFQGAQRPIKTHACVLATNHIEEVMERLMRRRLPFRIAPIDEKLAWERVWVGCTPENPRYSPVVDGGLCIELHPVAPLRIPAEAFQLPPPEPRDPAPGEMIRIVSRAFLVRDLDHTLGLLSANLDWEPRGPVQQIESEGLRRATLGFSLPHSGVVDLIEPTRWNSETGYYLNTWGPGPYYIRIAVAGLEAKAEDLGKRGTRFRWLPESPATNGRRIQVHPDELEGTLIEFVEYTA